MKKTCYLSFDVEADGPSPAHNSMIAFGVYGFDIDGNTRFSWKSYLKPRPETVPDSDTMQWWNSTQSNRNALQTITENMMEPRHEIEEFVRNVDFLANDYKLVPVAWPAAYDWQWINYYCHLYCNRNPLGYTSKCMGSFAWGQSGNLDEDVSDDALYEQIESISRLTHDPLEDATVQGKVMLQMLQKLRK